MPRAKRERQFLRLNKGLFTEGGYLNTPADVWTDAENVIPKFDGSVERRKGIDYEENHTLDSTNTSAENTARAFVTGYWDSAGGDGGNNFLVVQRGATVQFFDNLADELSGTKKAFTIALGTYKPAGNPNTAGDAPIQAVSANGKLLIVSGDTEPLLVEYDTGGGTITTTQLDLKIRDLEGVDDSLAVDATPATLSNTHQYNLQNQGWVSADWGTYFTANSVYPSNAQQWFYGVSGTTFSAAQLDANEFGSTPAPKGYYVLDLFDQQRDAVSGVSGITDVTENYRPTTVDFFAGRAWYAGIKSERIASNVYFSQVALTSDQYANCYQKNDPTAEIISDILDDDGGVITLQNAGTILRIMGVGDSIMAFCDNGVWRILPGSSGFTATSYSVEQVSNVACVSRDAVVKVDETVYFWGDSGIYRLEYKFTTQVGVTGKYVVTPITDDTIKSVFEDIQINAKVYAQGVHDIENRLVIWTYNSATDASTTDNRFVKDRIIIYDMRLNAWYQHSISSLASASPKMLGVFLTKGRGNFIVEAQVIISNSDTVIDTALDNVVVTVEIDKLRNRSIKYLCMTEQGANDFRLTVADFFNQRDEDTKWKDWYTEDTTGADVVPYLISGYALDNPQHKMDNTYITSYVLRTDQGVTEAGESISPGSVFMQGRWEWTDQSRANRWTTAEQVYRPQLVVYTDARDTNPPFGFPVIPAKSKIRGSGRALQIRYYGVADKDFKLGGWGLAYTIAQDV